MLGAAEDQDLLQALAADEVGEEGPLAVPVHGVDHLLHQVGGGVAPGHVDEHGVLQEGAGQGPDLVAEGGGEEQVLAPDGKKGQDLADVPDEAHVQHAVRFVQHQEVQVGEVQVVLAVVVQEAPGGGHQDLDARAQGLDLGVDVHAAVDAGGAQGQVAAVGVDALLHLHAQLAGGGEDQAADGVARGGCAGIGAGGQQLQDGKHEARGLARAGLGAGEQVAAVEDGGDGLLLDGGGGFVALLAHGTQQLRHEAEVLE